MKMVFLGAVLLTLVLAAPLPTQAEVKVNISIGLPPPIFFGAPPELIVLPETYVYVVPDVDAEIFFYDGWWWRPWEGRWYRSAYYDSGWSYYQRVPVFSVWIPSDWRNDYRDHRWKGRQWDYQRIPHQEVKQNWKAWEKEKHWEREHTWGVQGLQSRTGSQKPYREAQQPRQSGSAVKEVKPQRSQRHRETDPHSYDAQKTKPRKAARPKHQEAGPQSRERQQQQDGYEKGDGHVRR